ncbi:MAG: hypothetical protein WBN97_02935 [Parvibaculum sp.]
MKFGDVLALDVAGLARADPGIDEQLHRTPILILRCWFAANGDIISKDGSHPNVHIIFDNDPTACGQDEINRFLTNLETQSKDASDRRQGNRRMFA